MHMAALICAAFGVAAAELDPYLWLEEVHGAKATEWVAGQNARTLAMTHADPLFESTRKEVMDIMTATDHIPHVSKIGTYFYHFYTDAVHTRGVWRRTTLDEYRKAEPVWETMLDVDQLAKDEGERWSWGGAICRKPEHDRCLLTFTRGGGDASVVREYDLATRQFVKDGFVLPEAKQGISWLDRDTVLISRATGAEDSTQSGYPRVVKLWKRGTPVDIAETVFSGEKEDLGVSAHVSDRQGIRHQVFSRIVSFYKNETWVREHGKLIRVAIPGDAEVDFLGKEVLISLRSDWEVSGRIWKGGSLLIGDFAALQSGQPAFTALFEPRTGGSLDGYTITRDYIIVNALENVHNVAYEWRKVEGRWMAHPVEVPGFGSTSFAAIDPEGSNEYFLKYNDFLTPSSISLGRAGSDERELLKQDKARFDASGLDVAQQFAVSKDGTRVPYFIVKRKDIRLDGKNRVLMYGYGGFESSQRPFYSSSNGKEWMAKGGVYVLANIRGGGEYGPEWHATAVRENRQRSYDDFIAIAEDLIKRKITSPRYLAIEGYSNGGLLMGVMLTQRPDLFGAILSHVPLLDMKRYNKLFAGASWMDEYGNPDDPAQWAYISTFSPYHLVKKGVRYPSVLFSTSTRDDRVHPGHARKMVARMLAMGVKNVWLFENQEGGHAGADGAAQFADIAAMEYRFLWNQLGKTSGE
ncbi:prolyl oligopeptidase family serine peptidase [Burkholderiaceae bacterium DAT-1]|nr:prolyl oligopeptidase family serine peptidase [Burkholderiaceae bacterium DAT-1]